MKNNIGISLGNIKNLRDGLGEFSVQLCSRILKNADLLREKYAAELYFHVDKSMDGIFGDNVNYILSSRLQKFINIQPRRFFIWHTLNQLNKQKPPLFSEHKLITVHDLNFVYFKHGFSHWRDSRKIKNIIFRYDEVTTISDYVKNDIKNIIGWDRSIQVIYSGARNLTSLEQVRSETGFTHFLFHLSRMAPSKNIKAILALAAFWPEMNFVLAGPESADLSFVRRSSEGMPNVRVYANISDTQKAWFFSNCEGFIFPSLTEGFGLPPLEAMHFGKPVFLSNLTCLPEIGGSAAWYFQNFTNEHMKAVVESGLSSGPDQADVIRARAAQFNWDDCANKYIEIYKKYLDLRQN